MHSGLENNWEHEYKARCAKSAGVGNRPYWFISVLSPNWRLNRELKAAPSEATNPEIFFPVRLLSGGVWMIK